MSLCVLSSSSSTASILPSLQLYWPDWVFLMWPIMSLLSVIDHSMFVVEIKSTWMSIYIISVSSVRWNRIASFLFKIPYHFTPPFHPTPKQVAVHPSPFFSPITPQNTLPFHPAPEQLAVHLPLPRHTATIFPHSHPFPTQLPFSHTPLFLPTPKQLAIHLLFPRLKTASRHCEHWHCPTVKFPAPATTSFLLAPCPSDHCYCPLRIRSKSH